MRKFIYIHSQKNFMDKRNPQTRYRKRTRRKQPSLAELAEANLKFEEEVEGEYLPLHNVMSIVRSVIPSEMAVPGKGNKKVKLSKSFQIMMLKCIAEFIHLISIKLRHKRTVSDEDMLAAMEALGINQYSTYLRLFMSDYREMVFNLFIQRLGSVASMPALGSPEDEACKLALPDSASPHGG